VSLRRLVIAFSICLLSVGSLSAQAESAAGRLAIQRGNEKFSKQQYEGALKEYQRVARSEENYAQALYNIGVCYYELGNTEKAIDFYQKAISAREGSYAKAAYALGIALEDQGKFVAAKGAYRQAVEDANNDNGLAHYKLGLLAVKEGDQATAEFLFRQAIVSSKGVFPAGHNNLGVMLARAGRLAEADREFQIALQQSEGSLDDAAYNSKLCRRLMSAQASVQVAALKFTTQ